MLIQKQPFKLLYKIGALKTFPKFTEKLLRRSNYNVYKLIAWDPSNIYLITVSSRNTGKWSEICSSRDIRKRSEICSKF